jgi:uncharacterized membrane protein YhdT
MKALFILSAIVYLALILIISYQVADSIGGFFSLVFSLSVLIIPIFLIEFAGQISTRLQSLVSRILL